MSGSYDSQRSPRILFSVRLRFLLASPDDSPRPGASRSGKVPVGIAPRGFDVAMMPNGVSLRRDCRVGIVFLIPGNLWGQQTTSDM